MIAWNFFDKDSVIKGFEALYNVNREQLCALVNSLKESENPTADFLNTFPLELDVISIEDVYLHCKHITTTIDNLSSFEKYGFLTLNKMFKYKTPLNDFLNDNDIFVDLENKTLTYCGKTLYIVESDEECKECFYNSSCKHLKSIFSDNEPLSYRDMACSFREAIKCYRSKIYDDNGEIEVHLSGSYDDVHEYSTVKYYPEILYTIERMINQLFNEKISLTSKWRELANGKYYCMDFDVNINQFEYITKIPRFEFSWYMPFLDYCKNCYSVLDEVNANFLGNLFLICYGLEVLIGNVFVLYGQLYPDVFISKDDIKITEFNV